MACQLGCCSCAQPTKAKAPYSTTANYYYSQKAVVDFRSCGYSQRDPLAVSSSKVEEEVANCFSFKYYLERGFFGSASAADCTRYPSPNAPRSLADCTGGCTTVAIASHSVDIA